MLRMSPALTLPLFLAALLTAAPLETTETSPEVSALPSQTRSAGTPARSEILLRGVIHVHSARSFDSKGSFEQIGQAASHEGLDFVVITDHEAAKKPGLGLPFPASTERLLWIEGVEVEINEKHHLLILGPASRQVRWARGNELEGAREAKAKGALTFLNHFVRHGPFPHPDLLDGLEVYNAHEDLLDRKLKLPLLLFSALFSPKRLWHETLDAPQKAVALWEKTSLERPLAAIAGNDAHQNQKFLGKQLDPYQKVFQLVNTFVWARERSETGILQALKEGKSFFAFPFLSNPNGFSFTLEKESLRAQVILREKGFVKIKLFHNGKLFLEEENAALSVQPPQAGLWRCEVWFKAKETSAWKPWIYSNWLRIP